MAAVAYKEIEKMQDEVVYRPTGPGKLASGKLDTSFADISFVATG